jgi:hypothetical protein
LEDKIMGTLWLDRDSGGWRHKIDNDPVYCGIRIEAKIGGAQVASKNVPKNARKQRAGS